MHARRMEYDPNKAAANLRKHGVSFSDAEEVLRDPFGVTIEDLDASGERRFVTIGHSYAAELLVVVYTEVGAGFRLISARRAARKERKVYEG